MSRINNRVKVIGFVFLFVVRALITNAQTDTLIISFNEALSYATENAYLSKNATYDVEAAKKQVWEYLAIGFPQLNMAGGLKDNISIQENYITMEDEQGNKQIIKMRFGTQYSWNIGGHAEQLIFNGSYILGVKASRILVEMSKHQKEKTEIDVRENVAKAYLLALVAKVNLGVFKENLRVNSQTLKETEALFKNGFREELDVDQVRLMVNKSKNMVLEAERQLMIAKTVLKFTMGVPIDNPIKLNDNLDNLIVPVLSERVKLDSFSVNNLIDYTISETQVAIQKVKVQNEKAGYLPKLSAFYDYNYYKFGNKFSSMNSSTGQALGLTLNMPIFTSGKRNATIKKEKLNLLKAQNQQTMTEQNLRRQFLIA